MDMLWLWELRPQTFGFLPWRWWQIAQVIFIPHEEV